MPAEKLNITEHKHVYTGTHSGSLISKRLTKRFEITGVWGNKVTVKLYNPFALLEEILYCAVQYRVKTGQSLMLVIWKPHVYIQMFLSLVLI